MELLVAIAIALAAAAAGVTAAYGREFRRMAAFLRGREHASNARLTVAVPGRGPRELAEAINAELDGAAEERCQMTALQQEFQAGLASLSHDIRTPLAGAKGYGQLAAEEGDGQRRAFQLQRLQERLDAMEVLLDDLFAYAQSLDCPANDQEEPLDCCALLAEVLLGSYPAFEARGWEPVVDLGDEPLIVRCNRDNLGRVFENLIINCLHHGEAAPRIIRAGAAITITNAIDPVQPIDAARVFERFYRADSARNSAGAGLGLAVAANLCAAEGVSIKAETLPGLFAIRLDFSAVMAG